MTQRKRSRDIKFVRRYGSCHPESLPPDIEKLRNPFLGTCVFVWGGLVFKSAQDAVETRAAFLAEVEARKVSYPAWKLCGDSVGRGPAGAPCPSSFASPSAPAAGPASECVVGSAVDMASHVYAHSSPAGRALCEFECLHASRDYTAPGGGGSGGGGEGLWGGRAGGHGGARHARDPVLGAVLHHLGGGPGQPPY